MNQDNEKNLVIVGFFLLMWLAINYFNEHPSGKTPDETFLLRVNKIYEKYHEDIKKDSGTPAYILKKNGFSGETGVAIFYGYWDNESTCRDTATKFNNEPNPGGTYFCEELSNVQKQ